MSTSRSPQVGAPAELAETVVPGAGPGDPAQTQVAPRGGSPPAPSSPKVTSGAKSNKVYRLGDFELRKQLGQGGMGKVYLAHQISLDRPCAIKIMSSELAKKPGFVERFIREARAMAKIDHPNVVKCYAVDEQQGTHFVAMELIDGRSMQDWLDDLGKLSVEDALFVTLICAEALEHAHGLNMIHRDIKPDNILVTKHGFVKVSDLGLAKALDDDMSMTQSGTGLGTPHYMPPEQARDAKHADPRCDIYALGCTLYHFLTGKTPFAGDSVIELIKAKERGQFTPARRLNSAVPERLDLILDKMMAKDPRHRYASCAEVITDLDSLHLAGESLSFIDSDKKFVQRRGAGAPSPKARGASAAGRRPVKASSKSGSQAAPAARHEPSEDYWHVQFQDAGGKTKVARMTTAQILQSLRSDIITARARVSRNANDDFRPIAQVPVFEAEVKKSITRVRADKHQANMAKAYSKIERQYNRQKWWRLLARFRDGTLGLVGLILWLVIVAAAVVALGFGVMYAYRFLGESLNL